MSDFFPEPVVPDPDPDHDEPPQPVWLNPPEDVLPGVVPVELVLGQSDRAVVAVSGLHAYPTGLALTLLVRTRDRIRPFSLHDEMFDGPYHHDQDEAWQRDRFKWGLEYVDGRRVTNLDPWPNPESPEDLPEGPVVSGGGGGGSDRSVERSYWVWPLPPAGPVTVVCQWLQLGIQPTTNELDGDLVVAAAARARPLWDAD